MTSSFILATAWNANLMSSLATVNVQFPFDGLETLLKETNFKIAALPGSAHMDNFALSTRPNYVKAWKERMEPFLDEYQLYQGYYSKTLMTTFGYTYKINFQLRIEWLGFL